MLQKVRERLLDYFPLLGLLCLFAACFYCFKLDRGYFKEQFAIFILILSIPFIISFLLHLYGATKQELLYFLLPIGLALLLRIIFLDHVDSDYNNFIHPWYLSFQALGGFRGIAHNITNYNLPYQYFLALISYIPLSDLYLVKLFSIFFDFILALGGYRIIIILKKNTSSITPMVVFSILSLLPSIIMNSSFWGQCDSIYSAFCIHAVASALSGRTKQSSALFACALSFKLQAVFLLPFLVILWICRKLNFTDIIVFLVVFVLLLLPAFIIGKPLGSILRIYLDQSNQYKALSLNAPSIFQFLPSSVVRSENWILSLIGIGVAGLSVLLAFFFAYRVRDTITESSLLCFATLFVIAIPFFLPHMHERYFYLASGMSTILAFNCSEATPIPILVESASLISYFTYFDKQASNPIINDSHFALILGALAILLSLFLVVFFLYKTLREDALILPSQPCPR